MKVESNVLPKMSVLPLLKCLSDLQVSGNVDGFAMYGYLPSLPFLIEASRDSG